MNQILFETIDRYLNGEMSPEDRMHFEAKLQTDKELAEVFNLYRSIEMEMRRKEKSDDAETALKNTLQKLSGTYFEEYKPIDNTEARNEIPSIASHTPQEIRKYSRQTRTIPLWRTLAIAAAVIGIIVLGVTWYLQDTKDRIPVVADKKIDSMKGLNQADTGQLRRNSPPTHLADKKKQSTEQTSPGGKKNQEELFAKHFIPDLIPENIDGPLEDGLAYYENGEFKNAIAAIEKADLNAETRGPETDRKQIIFYAHYYKALSLMADNRVSKAIPELRNAIDKSPDNSLKIKAEWYLALAHLKLGNKKNANELFKKISEKDRDAEFKSRVDSLLIDLNDK